MTRDVHEPHGDFIDATAAPGNKTTHLSALLGNKGKVSSFTDPFLASWFPSAHSIFHAAQLFAFERDKGRFATLKSMLTKAGCQNVEPMNADFLAIRHDDRKYANVTHM
jgi:putative methyltransferase